MKPYKPIKSFRIEVRISSDLEKDLKKIALKRNTTLSELVRSAILEIYF